MSDKEIKNLEILDNLADFLKDTAGQMIKFSKSLKKALKTFSQSGIAESEDLTSISTIQESAPSIRLPKKLVSPPSIKLPKKAEVLPPIEPPKEIKFKKPLPSHRKDSLDIIKELVPGLLMDLKKVMEEEDAVKMTPEQRQKALRDMEEAIRILTKEYNQ